MGKADLAHGFIEIGRAAQSEPSLMQEPPVLFDDIYEASNGEEHFLSMEDAGRRAVFAFCRLRLPSRTPAFDEVAETDIDKELLVVREKMQEIRARLAELEEERFRLRFRGATEALSNPLRLRSIRRDIARLQTVLNEKSSATVEAAR